MWKVVDGVQYISAKQIEGWQDEQEDGTIVGGLLLHMTLVIEIEEA